MQISFIKSDNHHQKNAADRSRGGPDIPVVSGKRSKGWKPQPSGLTRDETRDLVREMIG